MKDKNWREEGRWRKGKKVEKKREREINKKI